MIGLLQEREGSWSLGVRRRSTAHLPAEQRARYEELLGEPYPEGERSWLLDFGSHAGRTREISCPGCGGRPRVNPRRLGARSADALEVLVD